MREQDPSLSLHAYVLSVTSPGQIGDEPRPETEWERDGIYFLDNDEWPRRMFGKILAPAA